MPAPVDPPAPADGAASGASGALRQPALTDGVVTLRPWRDTDGTGPGADVEAPWAGPAGVLDSWDGLPAAIAAWRAAYAEGRRISGFAVEHDGEIVGACAVTGRGTTGELSWTLASRHRGQGLATRAVRVLADYAMTESGQGGMGMSRIESHVESGDEAALRVATRAGLRREGVRREVIGTGEHTGTGEYVVLARLSTDPPLSDPEGFRALLNSFLPRKRAISQLLVRDERDRVLLCQLTYKRDWDLPGGVIEVGESPRTGVAREVEEELGLQVAPGRLLLTDWLPPWGGWDDAVCLVFDGGRHGADLVDRVVKEQREIRSVEFCTPEQVAARSADFTARRVAAALAELRLPHGGGYTESGR